MRIPLFLLTMPLFCTQAMRNLNADVQAFISKYRQMNETSDVLGSLERIGEDSRELFKLGFHVGKLLVNYNSTGKVTDDEKTALNTLHQLFNYSFERSTTALFGKRGLEYDALEPSSLNFVQRHMDLLTNSSRDLDDANRLIERAKDRRMSKKYYSHLEPLSYLSDILDSAVRLKCRMPTKKGIQTISKLQDAIRDVEFRADRKWNVHEFSAVDSFKTEFFHLLTNHPDEVHAEQLLKNITELKNIDFENVMDTLNTSHISFVSKYDIHPYMSKCLLETTNQTLLQLKLEYLYRELIQIHLLEWALSSVTEPDEKYYFKDGEISALLVERTGHFLADWTRNVQNISWPEIGTEFVKRAIEMRDFQNVADDETARTVQKAFEEHASPAYSYQVVVVPTSDVNAFWSVGSTRMEDYTNIIAFHGLDIHVFRVNRTEIKDRSSSAKKWMKNSEHGLKKEIGTDALSNTSSMLSYLQTQASVGPIYSDNVFRSVLLMKKTTISPSKLDMAIGFALSEDASYKLDVMRTSYSVLGHGKETVHSWKALFFM